MKRTWLSSAAVMALLTTSGSVFAADMAIRKAPPPLPIPIYNWTGFYIGGNLGGAWSNGTLTDNFTGAGISGNNNSGFIGGGQIGYNWQVSPNFVLGVEGMFDGASFNSSNNQVVVLGDTIHADLHTDWVSTLAARFGYAANNWLFYGKAGGGWVQNSATVSDLTRGTSVSVSNTNSGWLVGAGIEYGLTSNWTMKAEWDFLRLNSFTNNADFLGPAFVGDRFSLQRDINMFTVGVNYKF